MTALATLAAWVAHAYAGDATGTGPAASANPRGFGFPPGALDWEEYLGALEEIGYRGFLTVWPDRGRSEGPFHRHRRPAQGLRVKGGRVLPRLVDIPPRIASRGSAQGRRAETSPLRRLSSRP